MGFLFCYSHVSAWFCKAARVASSSGCFFLCVLMGVRIHASHQRTQVTLSRRALLGALSPSFGITSSKRRPALRPRSARVLRRLCVRRCARAARGISHGRTRQRRVKLLADRSEGRLGALQSDARFPRNVLPREKMRRGNGMEIRCARNEQDELPIVQFFKVRHRVA